MLLRKIVLRQQCSEVCALVEFGFFTVWHTHTYPHTHRWLYSSGSQKGSSFCKQGNALCVCVCACVWMMCIWWIRQARTMHYECPTQHFNIFIFMCMCHPFLLSSTSLLLSNKTSAVSLHFLLFFYILRRGNLSKMYSKMFKSVSAFILWELGSLQGIVLWCAKNCQGALCSTVSDLIIWNNHSYYYLYRANGFHLLILKHLEIYTYKWTHWTFYIGVLIYWICYH